MAKKPGARKVKKKVLSPADKALVRVKRLHINAIRRVLSRVGFRRVTDVADKEFTFDNQTTDIDDIYVYENVVLVIEYTASQTSSVGAHLKGKKIIYDKILADPVKFINFLRNNFPEARDQLPINYHDDQLELKILYCSRNGFDEEYRQNVAGPVYFGYSEVQYFSYVSAAIKRSARHEFFHFLGLPVDRIGSTGSVNPRGSSKNYSGSILPEAHSNFSKGYKIVSFYADAGMLLRTAYVLRKDGWRDSNNLYQRMIAKSKIELIRSYLRKQRRVFINNIIVTLPSDVRPLSDDKQTIDVSKLKQIAPVTIMLPDRANSIGIIDGQHRIFAYHETESDDAEIARLRDQQNLLITGIIYPDDVTAIEKEKFEARLFLEINSNQTSAKAPLKQAIGMVIEPFSPDSIATRIVNGLAKQGPLSGFVQQNFWDTDKLKTASIVSYGLRPLVKTQGTDSLFAIWSHPAKDEVAAGKNDAALKEYITFCVGKINIVFGAIKANLPAERWSSDKKVVGRLVSTTYINSFLIITRLLIERGVEIEFSHLKAKFNGIDKFPFSNYRSSQYRRLAEAIVKKNF